MRASSRSLSFVRAVAAVILLAVWPPLESAAQVVFTDVTAAAGVSYIQHTPNEDPASCLIAPLVPIPPELLDLWPEAPEQLPSFRCAPERFSGGGAVADIDGDGLPDLFVTRLDAPDVLFRNKGNGTFEDVTAAAGLAGFDLRSNGAAFADVDNDGDQDLYVTTISDTRHYLFINDGSGVFSEEAVTRAAAVSTAEQHIGFSVAFGDYDRDGFLDLFTTEWRMPGFLPIDAPSHARLLHNLGAASPGSFEDLTDAAGVAVDGVFPFGEFSWAPSFTDLDADGWPDLAVVGDAGSSRLFWNDGDGTFTDGTIAAGVGMDENGMGSTIADYDGDGDLDWFVSSIHCDSSPAACSGHRLFRNEGSRIFSDQTDATGVRFGSSGIGFEVGWGSAFFDYDNDGDLDLLMTNGVAHVGQLAGDSTDPSRLWRNDGPVMTDVATPVGITDVGHGKGLLTFDYDQDGDLDVFVVNNAAGPVLYRNDGGNDADWLRVKVQGGAGFNADAIGAVVTIEPVQGGPTQMREIGSTSRFLGQSERIAHFGLGDQTAPVYEVRVSWPGVGSSVYASVPVNQTFVATGPQLLDLDGDGLGDLDEAVLGTDPASPDSDSDGVPDAVEVGSVAAPTDTDGDGTIDALDTDDDGDGLPTASEDSDGNGNPADDDVDGDGTPDYLETDADDDGVDDGADNCPVDVNPSQSDLDGDGFGDPCQPGDTDGDGWPDAADNCPVVVNPGQEDTDSDGFGDACVDTNQVARQWNDELLEAIRRDFARPTVHARNLFHVSAAMWDAWAAYEPGTQQVFHLEAATAGDVAAARDTAISFASYRILTARFASSPGAAWTLVSLDARMAQLGYDKDFTATSGDVDPPAELGNRIAATVLAFGLTDGSNEQNGYENQSYQPVNPPLIVELPGNPDMVDDNRWQPLALQFFIDQSGNPIPGGSPPFLSPEWGQVVPFSLDPSDVTVYDRDGFDYWVYHDPGPPFLLGTPTAEDFLDGFEMAALWSSHLDPGDGVLWDISPASQGNSRLPDPAEWRTYYDFEDGGDWGTGYAVNPITGQPYTPQIVPRGDYARVLAEFWADGPDSETPPGHWFAIANYVSDNLAEKRIGGVGPILDELEWEVKLYLTLGGTMHDVAVTAWGMKGWYDYVRPVSALRAMAERGQRSDPGAASYDPEGLELRPGFIEEITAASSAPGERHEHLAAHVGEIAVYAWRGPSFIGDPESDVAGVGWIRVKDWWPYQRPSFVTPPFAGFPSGHSAYSRAAALVLHQLTGSRYFPGGLGEFFAAQNEQLVFEDGPSVDVTLQYASYYDASDQTSLSRIWGGIHPPQDDIVSRHIGAEIATDALDHVLVLFDGSPVDSDGDGEFDAFDNCPAIPNSDQADTDADDVGDVCDDLCVGEVTTLTNVLPDSVRKGLQFRVDGTGFGPSFEVRIGGVDVEPISILSEWWVFVPQGPEISLGPNSVQIVNPEGCRSQESVTLDVLPAKGCGLLGIEPLLVLLFGPARRGVRRLAARR